MNRWQEQQEEKLQEQLNELIWSTSTGEEIHVSELSDEHLIRIVNHLEKTDKHPFTKEWLVILKKEQDERQKKITDEFEDIS